MILAWEEIRHARERSDQEEMGLGARERDGGRGVEEEEEDRIKAASFITLVYVGPKAHHSSFDDDQLMKLCLLMILCLISDRFIIKILVGA